MNKIESFKIDHTKLQRGIYVSRVDQVGEEFVTTFDVRMKVPNKEPVLDVPAIHTIEHIGATFLRNSEEYSNQTIYFGPMGCRTGFYLILKGSLKSKEIVSTIEELFSFISGFDKEIPGATPVECGNYLSMDLPIARYESKKFLEEIVNNIKPINLVYPE